MHEINIDDECVRAIENLDRLVEALRDQPEHETEYVTAAQARLHIRRIQAAMSERTAQNK